MPNRSNRGCCLTLRPGLTSQSPGTRGSSGEASQAARLHHACRLSDDRRNGHDALHLSTAACRHRGAHLHATPPEEFHRFLRRIVEAEFVKRVMWGSDQMVWPGVIEPGLAAIEEADYLSDEGKRDIFYNNAARFLRLTEDEIARHHRK
jgi:hypothetical protein